MNRPQLLHAESQQSVSASEDYYSFSDYASSVSDARSPPPLNIYKTPPSRFQSPEQTDSHAKLGSEDTLPPMIPSKNIQRSTLAVLNVNTNMSPSPKATSSSSGRMVRRTTIPTEVTRPPPARISVASSSKRSYAPTPGIDDTPYIRFAIDQLTRDRNQRLAKPMSPASTEPDYPVDRIVHDEGLGYMEQERQRRQVREKPEPARTASLGECSGDYRLLVMRLLTVRSGKRPLRTLPAVEILLRAS